MMTSKWLMMALLYQSHHLSFCFYAQVFLPGVLLCIIAIV